MPRAPAPSYVRLRADAHQSPGGSAASASPSTGDMPQSTFHGCLTWRKGGTHMARHENRLYIKLESLRGGRPRPLASRRVHGCFSPFAQASMAARVLLGERDGGCGRRRGRGRGPRRAPRLSRDSSTTTGRSTTFSRPPRRHRHGRRGLPPYVIGAATAEDVRCDGSAGRERRFQQQHEHADHRPRAARASW